MAKHMPETQPSDRPVWKILALLCIVLGGLIFCISYLARISTLSNLDRTAKERLGLYEGTLNAALEKYGYLPYLLSRDETIVQLLSGRPNAKLVNTILETANDKAGSAAIFILDKTGRTLCSSNWKEPTSFVGQNYGYRPYFQDAMAGRQGGFYAIGATTGTPGYFMSHPVYNFHEGLNASPIGVIVVKVDLSGLERRWLAGGEIVFVSDANGVIFLSGQPQWKYKSLQPLTPGTLERIRRGRQYKGIQLTPLALEKGEAGRFQWIRINNEKFFFSRLSLDTLDWQLIYLIPWQRLEERVNFYLYISSAVAVLLIFGLLFAQEKRLAKISRQKAREAEKIGRINQKLRQEVEERRRTEAHLRQTQEELVQSAKLAALGQMAAAVVHELNQPISAIRTYAASCRLMAGQDKKEELNKTLFAVSDLTDRMEGITRQLKDFSRKSPPDIKPIDVRSPIERAAALLRYALSDAGCDLHLALPDQPLTVLGDRLRLEQVFVNLIKNSLDAMADQEIKTISIDFKEEAAHMTIRVWDTGPGIGPDLEENIFTPFFTTKAKGDGLGLGLSISQGIVQEMSGDLQLADHDGPGALFSVRLKKEAI